MQLEIIFTDPKFIPVLCEGAWYETSATNGAGLVCDVHATDGASSPAATFAHVLAVRVHDPRPLNERLESWLTECSQFDSAVTLGRVVAFLTAKLSGGSPE